MTTTKTLSSKLSRRVLSLVIALSLTGISPAVFAASKALVLETTVRYGDLNLEAETGAQALVTRLRRAATRLCRDKSSMPLELKRGVESRFVACRDTAVQNAVVKIDRPLVSQAYQRASAMVAAR